MTKLPDPDFFLFRRRRGRGPGSSTRPQVRPYETKIGSSSSFSNDARDGCSFSQLCCDGKRGRLTARGRDERERERELMQERERKRGEGVQTNFPVKRHNLTAPYREPAGAEPALGVRPLEWGRRGSPKRAVEASSPQKKLLTLVSKRIYSRRRNVLGD